jgi:peptidoglycan/xylan/chitin deacetylase (PgdA/CDA1 family)
MKKTIYLIIIVIFLTAMQITNTQMISEEPNLLTIPNTQVVEATPLIQPIAKKTFFHNIPILMYHVIEDDLGRRYEQLYVSPANFRQQLLFLKENGFHTVTVRDVLEHWQLGKELPTKPIVLSFDDGYLSIYTEAFPLLKELGLVATFYINTNKIGSPTALTPEMIREVSEAGIEIGSHSLSHLDLRKISSKQLHKEVFDSKIKLEALTGMKITTFCYPAGKYNNKVLQEVKRAQYMGAVTTKVGLSSLQQGVFTLSRVRINRRDNLEMFAKKIGAN